MKGSVSVNTKVNHHAASWLNWLKYIYIHTYTHIRRDVTGIIHTHTIWSVSLKNPDNTDIIINAPYSALDHSKCYGGKGEQQRERSSEASGTVMGSG